MRPQISRDRIAVRSSASGFSRSVGSSSPGLYRVLEEMLISSNRTTSLINFEIAACSKTFRYGLNSNTSQADHPAKRIDHNDVMECLHDAMRFKLVPISFQPGNPDTSTFRPALSTPHGPERHILHHPTHRSAPGYPDHHRANSSSSTPAVKAV